MNDNELLTNKELRESLKDKIQVLNKVKSLLLLYNSEVSTIKQVATYYEVGEEAIQSIAKRNKDELIEDGYKLFKQSEILTLLNVQTEQLENRKGKSIIKLNDDNVLEVPNRGLNLFTKRAILRVGMLLQNSNIAKEVRTQLLNTIEQTTDEQKCFEIDKQKDLIFKVVTATDDSSRMIALGEYNQYMSRYKDFVEKVVTSSTGITITKIAKELGFKSGRELNKILAEKKIQYKDKAGQWLLYSQYADKNYTAPYTYLDNKGDTHHSTNWTEAGKKFIYELLNK